MMKWHKIHDRDKSFVVTVIAGLLICLILVGGATAWIDPYFHYHGPIEGISYSFAGERYMNDGITRNLEYDAVITGTSMTENFKVSEFNELFEVNAVKVPFSGARNKEIGDNLRKGLETHNVKIVLRCLDYHTLLIDKDEIHPTVQYPYYLTNDNLFDDVNYLCNKEIFLYNTIGNVMGTIKGRKSTNFDDYSSWAKYQNGRENVLKGYVRPNEVNQYEKSFSDEDRQILDGNLEQNVVSLIKEYPETKFYIYFSPYSICHWDIQYRNGELECHKQMEIYTIEKLLQYDNVYLYSFNSRFDLIADLNNYRDYVHYTPNINSEILKWIRNDEGRLTHDNYKQYIDNCYETFKTYDYDSIYQ